MLEDFRRAVVSRKFSDAHIETLFYKLIDSEGGEEVINSAFDLLRQHRPELAKKIASDLLKLADYFIGMI